MGSYLALSVSLNWNYTNKSPGKGVSPAWLGPALTCPVRCSHSLQKSTVACSSKSPAQKLVQFDLLNQDDLGNSPQLPMNMTSFLERPKGATNEWCDAQGSPTPVATCPMVRPKMAIPKRVNDQQCSTTAKGATPRSGTTPSTGPATMKDSLAHHTSQMSDLVKWPGSGSGYTS